jgi:transposase, mutator family
LGPACAQLANRGLKDVLIVCCDGLTGFPEAIEADLARIPGPNLRGASDPGFHALRRLHRPESRHSGVETELERLLTLMPRWQPWPVFANSHLGVGSTRPR